MQDFLSSNQDGHTTFYLIAREVTNKWYILQCSWPTGNIDQKFKDQGLIPLNWFFGIYGMPNN